MSLTRTLKFSLKLISSSSLTSLIMYVCQWHFLNHSVFHITEGGEISPSILNFVKILTMYISTSYPIPKFCNWILSVMSAQSVYSFIIMRKSCLLIALQNKEEFLGHLPRINVRQEFHDDYYLCRELRHKLKDSKFSASCAMPPQSSSTSVNLEYHNTRELRDVAVSWPTMK